VKKIGQCLHWIDKISESVGKLVSFLILFIVALILAHIVARAVFDSTIIWADELIQFFFSAMVLLGGAYALSLGRHVRMDLFYAKLPPKKKATLDIITFIFFCLFIGLMLWKGLDATWDSIRLGERSDSVWGPVQWPAKMFIFLGALLICLQGLAKLIRDFTVLLGGKNDG